MTSQSVQCRWRVIEHELCVYLRSGQCNSNTAMFSGDLQVVE